jgi:hypothetical protein
VWIGDLVVTLVEREKATDAEEHHRDDEGIDIAIAAIAEGVFGGGPPLGLAAADQE